jgi:hypothetical protein
MAKNSTSAGPLLMSRQRTWFVMFAAWVASLVALLPTAAAVAVATATGDVKWTASAGMVALVGLLTGLLAMRRARVLLGLVPAALVLFAASLPPSSREILSGGAPVAITLVGLLAMVVSVLLLERTASTEIHRAAPEVRRHQRPVYERVRVFVAVTALPVPAALVLLGTPPEETARKLLSFAAVTFVWALVYYTLFAAPALNQEYELSRVELASRDPKARRRTGIRAIGAACVAVAMVMLAVFWREGGT